MPTRVTIPETELDDVIAKINDAPTPVPRAAQERRTGLLNEAGADRGVARRHRRVACRARPACGSPRSRALGVTAHLVAHVCGVSRSASALAPESADSRAHAITIVAVASGPRLRVSCEGMTADRRTLSVTSESRSNVDAVADELLDAYLDPEAKEMQHIGSYELPSEAAGRAHRRDVPRADVPRLCRARRRAAGARRSFAT